MSESGLPMAGRKALEYMADHARSAYTAADLADAVGIARPKVQAALAKARELGFVEYFPDYVGVWAVTRKGYLAVRPSEANGSTHSHEERYRMALEAILEVSALDAPGIARLALRDS